MGIPGKKGNGFLPFNGVGLPLPGVETNAGGLREKRKGGEKREKNCQDSFLHGIWSPKVRDYSRIF